jgi:N-acetylglucosamine-6-phosphate deacetylase
MPTPRGFVDLQVNGWMGIDFSAPALSVSDVRAVVRALVSRGTLAFCPTVVSSSEATYRKVLSVLAQAMREPDLAGHLLGIHLEGPFISPEDGARGVHPVEWIQPPSIERFSRLQGWAEGHIRLVTLAPERSGALEVIRAITAHGVVVALGHHLADGAAVAAAAFAGATGCTHLGNGIPGQLPRHPNPLWAQLACDALWGACITDGHHLPPEFIRVALRAKTPAGFLVTSDAAPIGGLPSGVYPAFGTTVEIEPSGRISCPSTGTLAGSHACLFECMNILAGLQVLNEVELWQVGCLNPLRALGRSLDDVKSIDGPTVRYAEGRFELGV